jgi:hypothetical protein
MDVEQIVRGENALLGDFTDALSAKVEQAIHDSMQSSDRSLYAAGQRIGVSDIGTCREYVRRMIVGLPWSDPQEDYSAAFMGTAVGDHIEAAMASEEVRSQVTVAVNLKVRGYQMSVPGHVDLVGPDWMTDIKSKAGLTLVRRVGPSLNNIFQATLYAAALIESGDLPEDCMVSLTFVDRSGVEKTPYVVAWRFSRVIVGLPWNGSTTRSTPSRTARRLRRTSRETGAGTTAPTPPTAEGATLTPRASSKTRSPSKPSPPIEKRTESSGPPRRTRSRR